MKYWLYLILLLPLAAQTKQTLPNWVGAGGSYDSADSPKFSSWVAMALPVSTSQQVYSYSMYQILPVSGHVPTISTTTGLATIIRQVGRVTILGLATAGVATTGTAAVGAFAGGGMGVYRFKSGFTLEAGAIVNKSGGAAKPQYLLGGGWTW